MNEFEERALKLRADARSTDDLIRLVLAKNVDEDNDDYWHPVWCLQHRLSQIMEFLKALAESPGAKEREVAATILGQNGVQEKIDVSQCVDLLLTMLQRESNATVLAAIAHAMGHLNDPRSIESLLRLKRHPNSEVRYAVVHGLSGCENEPAIQALIELSADQDDDVRNWATFGLGSMMETDTPEIRNALLARLEETDAEIRCEALAGLAQRGDVRAVDPMVKEFNARKIEHLREWDLLRSVAELALSSAQKAGDQRWLPVLEKMKNLGLCDSMAVQTAIENCTGRKP